MNNSARKRTGFFISFEGGDGAGKTTQIKRLSAALEAAGRNVIATREPGGADGAEAIRTLLVEGDADRWSPLCEALLVYASRADHLERTILPALEDGSVVISDRFADSTMAYQGIAGALGEEAVTRLHELVVGPHDPDLTIILDLPSEEGLARAGARGGAARFEEKGADYQQRVREAFLTIAGAHPERCVVIDASGDADKVAALVLEAAKARLPKAFV